MLLYFCFKRGCKNFVIFIKFEIVDFLIYCLECFFIVLIKFFIFLFIIVFKNLIKCDVFWSFVNMVNMLLFIIFRILFINFNDDLIWNKVNFLIFLFNSFLYFEKVFWKVLLFVILILNVFRIFFIKVIFLLCFLNLLYIWRVLRDFGFVVYWSIFFVVFNFCIILIFLRLFCNIDM